MVKVTFKQTVKNNDYWIFQIFTAFTLVFFVELETTEEWIVQGAHQELETTEEWIVQGAHHYLWAAAGHELKALGTHAQCFNLWSVS